MNRQDRRCSFWRFAGKHDPNWVTAMSVRAVRAS
jgi:hypothetical protein